jgi:hypothetical protein
VTAHFLVDHIRFGEQTASFYKAGQAASKQSEALGYCLFLDDRLFGSLVDTEDWDGMVKVMPSLRLSN